MVIRQAPREANGQLAPLWSSAGEPAKVSVQLRVLAKWYFSRALCRADGEGMENPAKEGGTSPGHQSRLRFYKKCKAEHI